MDYQRIVDELRRKAEKLSDAADTIEAVYLGSQEDAAEAMKPARRWAPGRGEPDPQPALDVAQQAANQAGPRPELQVNKRPPTKAAVRRPHRKTKPAPPPPARPAVSAPRRLPTPVQADMEEVVAELDKKTHLALITGIREMLAIGVARQVLPQTVVNWCAAKGMSVSREQVDEAIAEALRAA